MIAFPKTQRGQCLMTDAPGHVDEEQLDELLLKSTAAPKETTAE